MSGAIARDLKEHLSRELQALFRRHITIAEGALAPAETLQLMMIGATDLACCAISSAVASIAASDATVNVETLLDSFVAMVTGMLASQRPSMIAKIELAVRKRRTG